MEILQDLLFGINSLQLWTVPVNKVDGTDKNRIRRKILDIKFLVKEHQPFFCIKTVDGHQIQKPFSQNHPNAALLLLCTKCSLLPLVKIGIIVLPLLTPWLKPPPVHLFIRYAF